MAGAGEHKQETQRGSCAVVTGTWGQEGLREVFEKLADAPPGCSMSGGPGGDHRDTPG